MGAKSAILSPIKPSINQSIIFCWRYFDNAGGSQEMETRPRGAQ